MLLIHPQFSLITTINAVTILKYHYGEIPERFPSSPATELGRMPVSVLLDKGL
jgi:hypothetical protein